jgi:hypothetical protein
VISLEPEIYERLDKLRATTGLSLNTVIYCIIHGKAYPKPLPKSNVQLRIYVEDHEKLKTLRENNVENMNSLITKLLNNGEEIEYIKRW